MSKCVVTGCVKDRGGLRYGSMGFWALNGDIEQDENGNEVYICECRAEHSDASVEVRTLVKDMPQEVQQYIADHKQIIP